MNSSHEEASLGFSDSSSGRIDCPLHLPLLGIYTINYLLYHYYGIYTIDL